MSYMVICVWERRIMHDLFCILIAISFVVLFFAIVDFEMKRIKLVIDNDVVFLQWRHLCYNKVALKQVKAISIKSATYISAPMPRRNSNGRLVGCLSLHDSDQPITLSMHKTASYVVGQHSPNVLLSIVFNPDELNQLMAVTNIPIYVTASFFNDYGSSIGEMLPINDPRIHICN